MRFFLLLSLIVMGMWVAGWLTFGREPGRLSVTVEAQKMRLDAAMLLAKCEGALDAAANDRKANGNQQEHRSSMGRDHL